MLIHMYCVHFARIDSHDTRKSETPPIHVAGERNWISRRLYGSWQEIGAVQLGRGQFRNRTASGAIIARLQNELPHNRGFCL